MGSNLCVWNFKTDGKKKETLNHCHFGTLSATTAHQLIIHPSQRMHSTISEFIPWIKCKIQKKITKFAKVNSNYKRESVIIRIVVQPIEVHEGRWLVKLNDEVTKEPIKD